MASSRTPRFRAPLRLCRRLKREWAESRTLWAASLSLACRSCAASALPFVVGSLVLVLALAISLSPLSVFLLLNSCHENLAANFCSALLASCRRLPHFAFGAIKLVEGPCTPATLNKLYICICRYSCVHNGSLERAICPKWQQQQLRRLNVRLMRKATDRNTKATITKNGKNQRQWGDQRGDQVTGCTGEQVSMSAEN